MTDAERPAEPAKPAVPSNAAEAEKLAGRPEPAKANPPAEVGRRRQKRHSLLSLVFFVLLAVSGTGVWWRWQPWVRSYNIAAAKPAVAVLSKLEAQFFAFADSSRLERRMLENGRLVSSQHVPFNAEEAAMSPDGKHILMVSTGPDFGRAAVWDWVRGITLVEAQTIGKGQGNEEKARGCCRFAADGKVLLAVPPQHPEIAELLDSQTGRFLFGLETSAEVKGPSAIPSYDGKMIATLRHDGPIRVHDSQTGNVIQQFENKAFRRGFAFSPDGKTVALGEYAGISIWEMDSGKMLSRIRAENGNTYKQLAFAPDKERVAAVDGGTVTVFELSSGKAKTFKQFAGELSRAEFTADSRRIIAHSAQEDAAYILDASSGATLAVLTGGQGIRDVLQTSDMKHMLLCSETGDVTVWRRRHPEWWWGIAWLPEFWAALIFGCGLIWSIRMDRWEPPKQIVEENSRPDDNNSTNENTADAGKSAPPKEQQPQDDVQGPS